MFACMRCVECVWQVWNGGGWFTACDAALGTHISHHPSLLPGLLQGDCSGDVSKETYNDYAGAMRCLMENSGDVAFVKHTTAREFASDGSTPQSWSSKKQEDMRLLCPSGGCKPVSQYLSCNMASVPAHAVLVRSSYPDTGLLKRALVAASLLPAFRSLVFSGTSNPNSFLFKPSTK